MVAYHLLCSHDTAANLQASDLIILNVFDEISEDPVEPSTSRSVYTRTRAMLPPTIKRMECGRPNGPPGAMAADDEECDCVQRWGHSLAMTSSNLLSTVCCQRRDSAAEAPKPSRRSSITNQHYSFTY